VGHLSEIRGHLAHERQPQGCRAGALFWTELGSMSAIMVVFNLVPWRLGTMDTDGLQVLREIRQLA
jgi:Zn-dependent protease